MTTTLDELTISRVRELCLLATEADGHPPLNEEARLALTGREGVRHHLVGEDEVIGYAQFDEAAGTGQLVVDPRHRRRGVGSALLNDLLAEGASGVWSFGHLPAAASLATRAGLVPGRGLLIMQRDLRTSEPGADLPQGVTLDGFVPERDTTGFLAANALAFADHPEQGRFSLADLEARMAEPWFDPQGLIVARDAEGVLGFHWTKQEPEDPATGEVYVLGVHPRAQGLGLGRVLLRAGLASLLERGAERILLYVDLANTKAVELYRHDGFVVISEDVLYSRP